jgi:hypothetical protein
MLAAERYQPQPVLHSGRPHTREFVIGQHGMRQAGIGTIISRVSGVAPNFADEHRADNFRGTLAQ